MKRKLVWKANFHIQPVVELIAPKLQTWVLWANTVFSEEKPCIKRITCVSSRKQRCDLVSYSEDKQKEGFWIEQEIWDIHS